MGAIVVGLHGLKINAQTSGSFAYQHANNLCS